MTPESVEVAQDISVVHSDAPSIVDETAAVVVPVESHERHRGVLGELPLASVIGGVALGLVIIALHHFRWGNLVIAASVMAGALFRAILPTRQAGLLAVRSRFTDVLTLVAIGGALMVLALITRT